MRWLRARATLVRRTTTLLLRLAAAAQLARYVVAATGCRLLLLVRACGRR